MNAILKRTLRRLLPRTIKPHSIRAGPLRNYRIVTSWHDYPAAILGRTERPLLEWFARNVHQGETWLDIGAHYGYTAIALARYVGKGGRVFALEPVLASAACITETRRLNSLDQLVVIPFGLGDVPGFCLERLPVVRGMADSTLLTPRSSPNDWSEVFLVARLDELWASLAGGDSRVDGVKIDVQGMELAVLRGMRQILASQHPRLVLEVHDGVPRRELVELLAAVGYASPAQPIEPAPGEVTPQFLSNYSYAFSPNS